MFKELKLNELECSDSLRFEGYRAFSHPRAGDSASYGGGVCVLVREFIQRDKWSFDDEVEATYSRLPLNE